MLGFLVDGHIYKKSTISSCGDNIKGHWGMNICMLGKIIWSVSLNKLLLYVRICPLGLHVANGRGNVCLCPLVELSKLLYALVKSRVA